jgi:hypothetical protein
MTWAHVQNIANGTSGGGNTSLTATFGSNVTAGDLIVVTAINNTNSTSGTLTLTDSQSNTYALQKFLTAGNPYSWVYYTIASTTGSLTITASFTATGEIGIVADEFSFTPGTITTAIAGATGSGSSPASGNVSWIGNALLYNAVGSSGSLTFTPGLGFTLWGNHPGSIGNYQGQFTQGILNDTSNAANCTGTLSGSATGWLSTAIVFQSSGDVTSNRIVNATNDQSKITVSGLLGTTGDAIVAQGSTTYGTDYTAALQAIINDNVGRRIIWDGQYSHTGLFIPSNTYIEYLQGAGEILRPNSGVSLLRNSSFSFGIGGTEAAAPGAGTPAALGNYGNTNITLIGGIHNCNGQNQTPASSIWQTGLQFFGVQYLTIKDMQIFDSFHYATQFANVSFFYLQNCRIDQSNRSGTGSTDGLHIHGPAQYIYWLDNTVCTGSDGCAINADDQAEGFPTWPYGGPITDMEVNGLHIYINGNFGQAGFRLQGNSSLMDRIKISGVRGVTRNAVGKFTTSYNIGTMFQAAGYSTLNNGVVGEGNMRNIIVSDVQVDVVETNSQSGGFFTQYPNCHIMIDCGGPLDLTLKNIKINSQTTPEALIAQTNGKSTWYPNPVKISLEDVSYMETNTNNSFHAPLMICNGNIHELVMRGVHSFRTDSTNAADSPLLQINPGCASVGIQNLIIDGCSGRNVNSLVEGNGPGYIGSMTVTNTLHDQCGKTLASPVVLTNGFVIQNSDTRGLTTTATTKVSGGTIINNIDTGGTYAETANGLLTRRLLSYNRFNDSGGTTVVDQSTNANTFTAAGTITRGVGPNVTNMPFALTFNGSQAVSCTNPDLAAGPYSVGCWVNFGSTTGTQCVWGKGSTSAVNNYYGLLYTNGNSLLFSPGGNTVTTFSAGTWYFIVTAVDQYHEYVYVNGTLVGTFSPWHFPTVLQNACDFIWGSYNSSNFLSNGSLMSGGFVYTGVLSANQITNLYNSGNGIYVF